MEEGGKVGEIEASEERWEEREGDGKEQKGRASWKSGVRECGNVLIQTERGDTEGGWAFFRNLHILR